MTTDTRTTTKKPGAALAGTGIVLTLIAMILIVLPMFNDEPQLGSPVAFITLLLGLILAAFGFGRRVLSALEKR